MQFIFIITDDSLIKLFSKNKQENNLKCLLILKFNRLLYKDKKTVPHLSVL